MTFMKLYYLIFFDFFIECFAKMRGIVLLSGGLDSTTMLRIVQEQKYEVYALTFNYGQKHSIEIEKAKNIAKRYNVSDHKIIDIDIKSIGGSALTDDTLQLQKNSKSLPINHLNNNIPLSYVPARNTIFLSYALGYAEVIKASRIFIGINAIDYSGYPDCRPEYLKQFNILAKLATAASVKNELQIEVEAPLLYMSKAEIINQGLKLRVDYNDTMSCYEPSANGHACGKCDACILRLNGFAENNMYDPAKYQNQ